MFGRGTYCCLFLALCCWWWLLFFVLVGYAYIVMTQARTVDTAFPRVLVDVLIAGRGEAGWVYACGMRCKLVMHVLTYSVSSSYDLHFPGRKRHWWQRGICNEWGRCIIIPSMNPDPSSSCPYGLLNTCIRAWPRSFNRAASLSRCTQRSASCVLYRIRTWFAFSVTIYFFEVLPDESQSLIRVFCEATAEVK